MTENGANMKLNDPQLSLSLFTEHSSGSPLLFQGLSKESLEAVIEKASIHHFEANKLLVSQGDEPNYLYFIVEGRGRTFRSNVDGDETTLRLLEAGDTCMESAIFMGGTSPVTFQTVVKSCLMLIPASFIKQFVLQDTIFSNNMLKIVTHHYKNAIHQIDAMAIKSPVQRVGYFFLKKHLESGSETMDFSFPFKKSTVANHLGITPETFSRALAQLKKMGLEVKGDNIRLKDAFSLCHFCDLESAQNCDSTRKDECPSCPLNKNNDLY